MAITKIGTPELFDFSSLNTALQLPTGPTSGTGGRPSTPSTGEWRFNTTLKYVEYWDGGAWRQIDTEELPNSDDFPSQNFNVNTYFGNGASQTIDAKFNEAANFDGASSYIQIANDSFTYTTMTFSAWVNPTANDTYNYIFQTGMYDNRIGGSIGWYVRRESGGSLLARGFSSNSLTVPEFDVTSSGGNIVPLNTWTNVVCVLTPTSFNIYINGSSTAVASATFSNAITYSASQPSAVVIGANYYYFNAVIYEAWWEGAIDQVRIFNTALTSAQVEDLYTDETTTTAATLDFPAGAGCTAAYQLDGDASDVGGTYGGVETNIGYTGLKFAPDLVWVKNRTDSSTQNLLTDTVRGIGSLGGANILYSDSTEIESTNADTTFLSSFDSNGFTIGNSSVYNNSSKKFVAWCWKAGGAASLNQDGDIDSQVSANVDAGFSIATWTGDGTASNIGHGLGGAPDLMIIKNRVGTNSWIVGVPNVLGTGYLVLNDSGQASTSNLFGQVPDATKYYFNTAAGGNGYLLGGNYVGYFFRNIAGYQRISSYTGTGNNPGPIVYTTNDGTATGTDGFEPAMIIIKRTDSTEDWKIIDNKRGFVNSLEPNEAIAEEANNNSGFIAATNGFQINDTSGDYNANGGTYIYLAIAADKDSSVPTAANSFKTSLYTGNGGTQSISTPFAPDFIWMKRRNTAQEHALVDSVRGVLQEINSDTTAANLTTTNGVTSFDGNGWTMGANGLMNNGSDTYVGWAWKAGGLPTINSDGTRTSIVSANAAAGFSIVKWTGDGAAATIGHGLGAAPGLILVKKLTGTSDWPVYSSGLTSAAYRILLNSNVAEDTTNDEWNSTAPTTVSPFVFSVGNGGNVSDNGGSFIAYCFANSPGYQQAGSYSGSSSSVTINFDGAGFNPSFVMIKRTNATGQLKDWTIFDQSLSGSTTMNDYLIANSSAAEFTNSGSEVITATSTGFTIAGGVWDGLNASGGEYLYLAVK